MGITYIGAFKCSTMTYNLKSVFYLGIENEYASGSWDSKDSVQPLDISAYVDPISKGRNRGQGLAIYRVHHALSTPAGCPIKATETASMGMALSVKPYTTTGDLLSGAVAYGDLSPSSDLVIQGDQFMGTASGGTGSTNNVLVETCSPSEEVPYVAVRDTIFAIMLADENLAAEVFSTYRMECAPITLDTATLNQLLRTQTA
jgi:hypothetical protein